MGERLLNDRRKQPCQRPRSRAPLRCTLGFTAPARRRRRSCLIGRKLALTKNTVAETVKSSDRRRLSSYVRLK